MNCARALTPRQTTIRGLNSRADRRRRRRRRRHCDLIALKTVARARARAFTAGIKRANVSSARLVLRVYARARFVVVDVAVAAAAAATVAATAAIAIAAAASVAASAAMIPPVCARLLALAFLGAHAKQD